MSVDQKKIYEELTIVRSKQKVNNNDLIDNMNGLVMIHGRKMSSNSLSNGLNAGGWFEYGAIGKCTIIAKSYTDLGNLIENTQCGNLRILLPVRFYVKTISVLLKPQKLPF